MSKAHSVRPIYPYSKKRNLTIQKRNFTQEATGHSCKFKKKSTYLNNSDDYNYVFYLMRKNPRSHKEQ